MADTENRQQGATSTSESVTEQTPSETTQVPPESQKPSRRSFLKVGAIAGGTLAVAGGATLAASSILNKPQVQTTPGGQLREYWVQADAFFHNLVPTGKDGMMGQSIPANQVSYWAVGYRAYTPGWGKPLPGSDDIGTNTGIPGPVFRGAVGDTIRVHFRNNDTQYKYPHSIHPHGVSYTPTNDGAWYALNPKAGTAIEFGQSYTYEWQVRTNSVGSWVYHDHSRPSDANQLMEFGAQLGMIGFLVLTDSSTKPVEKEIFTFLHDLYQSDIPSLSQDYDCINGASFLGNTPTFTAKLGETVRWHVGALGKEFHVFHVHGHRWQSGSQFVDTVHLGPAIATSFEFVEDNPGKWLYHCHVTDHMGGGMIGFYEVTA